MNRNRDNWCMPSPESMLNSDARRTFGTHRGEVVCPDCGRTIKLSKGNGAVFTRVPAHKKPKGEQV